VKRYTWRTTLYGSETWTLRKIALTFLKCGDGEERGSSVGTDRVKNEEVLHRVKKNILHTIRRRKMYLDGSHLKHVTEENIDGTGG
jgi:hypothetical protein